MIFFFKMSKKITMLLAIVAISFSATMIPLQNNEVQAATKCVNPYKGSLEKYNPCITHVDKSYVKLTRPSSSSYGYVVGAFSTSSLNAVLLKAGYSAIPYAGALMWTASALEVAEGAIYRYRVSKGVKGFYMTYTWKYERNPLSDGGGIPHKKVIKVTANPSYY